MQDDGLAPGTPRWVPFVVGILTPGLGGYNGVEFLWMELASSPGAGRYRKR